jgi:hypothetical protein
MLWVWTARIGVSFYGVVAICAFIPEPVAKLLVMRLAPPACTGSFHYVAVRFSNGNFAQDDRAYPAGDP